MASWLETMMAEINAVTTEQAASAEPKEKGCQHEHIVGVLDEDLKKLFFLFGQYFRRAHELKKSLMLSENAEQAELEAELDRFVMQVEALKSIFMLA